MYTFRMGPVGALFLSFILGFLALMAFGAPARAMTTYYAKFYNGGAGYSGPFSGVGSIYDHTKSFSTTCPAVGTCLQDNIATPLAFGGTVGITATAGGGLHNKVWDDLSPNFGGLGVGTGSRNDTDQIAGRDVLSLAFNSTVTLTGVGTLFASGHEPFGSGFDDPSDIDGSIAFLLKVDGGNYNPVTFALANSALLSLTGKTFSFMQKEDSPEFYVSALSYQTSCGGPGQGCALPGTTPLPASLPLFATALGALALLGFGRKRRGFSFVAAA
jgi:hypothetical protein